MKLHQITFLSFVTILASSSCIFDRDQNCHLDQFSIFGDVKKVETIVQSTMPLTELYYICYNPQYTIFGGNTCVEFDRRGNVKNFTAYGIDGNILFNERHYRNKQDFTSTPTLTILPEGLSEIDKIETTLSDSGKITNVKYFKDEELIWNQFAEYNKDGSISSITTIYETLSIRTDFLNLIQADTTKFNYLSYDNMKNWTEVEVKSTGILPSHKHSHKIKRQITYWRGKKNRPLIDSLEPYNHREYLSTTDFKIVELGEYGSIKIPSYMKKASSNKINMVINNTPLNNLTKDVSSKYLFLSEYEGSDSYATISAMLFQTNDTVGFNDWDAKDLEYDKDIDEYLKEGFLCCSNNSIRIIKWLPYEFSHISGKRVLIYRYYRYGNGNPIPVYCEVYTIPMHDGYTMGITCSFNSYSSFKFKIDFEKSIRSIHFE